MYLRTVLAQELLADALRAELPDDINITLIVAL